VEGGAGCFGCVSARRLRDLHGGEGRVAAPMPADGPRLGDAVGDPDVQGAATQRVLVTRLMVALMQ